MTAASFFIFLALSLAGGAGASLRFLVDTGVHSFVLRWQGDVSFPWGMWLVNLSGSFAIGVLVGLAARTGLPQLWLQILGVGFLGGFTTFSSVSFDTVNMLRERRYLAAGINGLGLLIFAVAVALLGIALGAKL